MNGLQLLFLLIVFAVVGGLAWLGAVLFVPEALRARLGQFAGGGDGGGSLEKRGWIEHLASMVKPLTRLSVPEEGWEKSALRTRFMNAGWRNPGAPALFFAGKSALALLLPAAVALVLLGMHAAGNAQLAILLCAAALGYYLPNIVLARTAKRRQLEVFESIPDAIDLLTVCVEAGLSLERALVKVAAEIGIRSQVLAQELQLVLMEMRAGFTKEKALRNLALRTGVDDIDVLVAMLVQSERFGTSVGDALRVHSDNLRTKRRMLAEEKAAKIGLKLMFPLIFFIFPVLLIVLLGPALITITQTLFPMMTGTD